MPHDLTLTVELKYFKSLVNQDGMEKAFTIRI